MQPIPRSYRLYRRIHEAAALGPAAAFRWLRRSLRRRPVGAAPAFPDSVSVEITDLCNLSCPSCPQPQMTGEKGYMSDALFRKIVDECAAQPAFSSLVITGYGEPLLHSELCSMSRYAKSKGIPIVRTYTNARSLGREHTDELLLHSGFDEITLSLNGPTPETYEKIKGSNDFERVRSNIRYFLERKRELRRSRPFVNVHVLALASHEHDMDAFVAEWKSLLSRGDCLALKPSHSFAGQVADPAFGALEDHGDRRPCGQLWNLLFVARGGEVSPCCVDPFKRLAIGNVRDSSLGELWRSSMLEQMRGYHEEGRYEALPLCSSCQTWRYFTTGAEAPFARIRRLLGPTS